MACGEGAALALVGGFAAAAAGVVADGFDGTGDGGVADPAVGPSSCEGGDVCAWSVQPKPISASASPNTKLASRSLHLCIVHAMVPHSRAKAAGAMPPANVQC